MMAPAAVSCAASNGRLSLRKVPTFFLDSERATPTTLALAAGELIADKTPFIPGRLRPPSLIWRLVSGAVCGAAFFDSDDERLSTGAILGAAGALVGSLLGYAWRTRVREQLDLPDFASDLIEDALAFGLAVALVSYPTQSGAHDAWADVDNPAWLP
jgi:uncharacterized membrane protein